MGRAEAKDPFADLDGHDRCVTPRVLRGKPKEIWNQFVKNYHNNRYAGMSMRLLFEWAQKHCGLTCSVSSFRKAILDQAPGCKRP